MYLLKIIFLIAGINNNSYLTIEGFPSKEVCEQFSIVHNEELVPYFKGFFQLGLDTDVTIYSKQCEKDSV